MGRSIQEIQDALAAEKAKGIKDFKAIDALRRELVAAKKKIGPPILEKEKEPNPVLAAKQGGRPPKKLAIEPRVIVQKGTKLRIKPIVVEKPVTKPPVLFKWEGELANDSVFKALQKGRLTVHMIPGTLITKPAQGYDSNPWHYDLSQIFSVSGYLGSSSLVPSRYLDSETKNLFKIRGTSLQTIYGTPFGLLTTMKQEDIIISGHTDIGTNAAKKLVGKDEQFVNIKHKISEAVNKTHKEHVVNEIESLNDSSPITVKGHNNEVFGLIKAEHLLGILIHYPHIKDEINVAKYPEWHPVKQHRITQAVAFANAIREYIDTTYKKKLPIYKTTDGCFKIQPC